MEKVVKTEKIDMTPHISLFPKIGKSGYTLTQSVAELVDNSIDARISGVELEIKIVIQDDFILVEDNGSGMTREVAEKALRLGYSDKENALGEFGLGLKSACTSIGSKFTIRTYPVDKKEGYEYVYDEKKWMSKADKDCWFDDLKIFEKDETKRGTWIKIENPIRRISKQRKIDIIKDFSKRFSPFIQSGEVKIFVNQDLCSPEDIELNAEGKKNFEIPLDNGNKLYGWYGLMKKGSDRGQYGFTTFRRGRMITCYDKIGIPHHPAVSRIVGEVHMDHVPVSHSKKEFETESEEYKHAVLLLTTEFREIVRKARDISLSSKVTEDIKNDTDAWKGAIVESFHKKYKDLVDVPPIKKRTHDSDDPVGELIIEKRDPKLNESLRSAIEKNEKTRNPQSKRQKIVSHFITIEGRRYLVNHIFAQIGENQGWKVWDYVKGKGTIEVVTNQDFPVYALTKDVGIYAAIHIAESIAEIIGDINNYNTKQISEIKETLLRNAAEILDKFREQLRTVNS